jgi:hypothetical protein
LYFRKSWLNQSSSLAFLAFFYIFDKNKSMLSKKTVLETVNSLPDSFSLEEMIDRLILIQKVELGLSQSMENQVVSHEEAKEKLNKWFK